MSQTIESKNPLADAIDFERENVESIRSELREQFVAAVIDIAHGKEVADADSFVSWGLDAGAFSEHEARELVGQARQVLRDLELAKEFEDRQAEATKAAENFIAIRDQRMRDLKEAADRRRVADNARQTSAEAIQRIQAIRNKHPELFNADGSFKQPSK